MTWGMIAEAEDQSRIHGGERLQCVQLNIFEVLQARRVIRVALQSAIWLLTASAADTARSTSSKFEAPQARIVGLPFLATCSM